MIEVGVFVTVVAGPVVTVGKPERFLRRLFQAAVEIIKKKLPEASFVDFHSCGSFHRLFFYFFGSFFFFFLNGVSLVENRAESRYESATRLLQRFQETFERDPHGESCDVCSDDVLRGLDYKDYGHSLSVGVWLGDGSKEFV